jgi:transcriptional regulator with XRE-family HTH domain
MIAQRLIREREKRNWSLAALAARSGVSKAMISKIERAEASPTAALLGRLSGAFGLTLSALLSRADADEVRLVRAAQRPEWRDPETGYMRKPVPSWPDGPFEMTEIELPQGASVRFPAAAYAFARRIIWMISGALVFVEGGSRHDLRPGDCLRLGPPSDCEFRNESSKPARYAVMILRQ